MGRKLIVVLLAAAVLLTGCAVSLYSENAGREVVLFLPNEDGTGFDSAPTVVPRDGILGQAVVDALEDAGAIPAGFKIKRLEQTGSAIAVDFNDRLEKDLAVAGSTEEYMCLGSLVNSLLNAYGADTIRLTSEGEPLETGHNIYDQPLGRFEGEELS